MCLNSFGTVTGLKENENKFSENNNRLWGTWCLVLNYWVREFLAETKVLNLVEHFCWL